MCDIHPVLDIDVVFTITLLLTPEILEYINIVYSLAVYDYLWSFLLFYFSLGSLYCLVGKRSSA